MTNAKPVKDAHGTAQNEHDTGNHPAGKNECAGNMPEGVEECNDGTGICVWLVDRYGNKGHKECLTSCGPLPLDRVPDHASSPADFDPEAPENMVVGATVTFDCDGSFASTCNSTDAICLASGEWLLPDFECRFVCNVDGLMTPKNNTNANADAEVDVYPVSASVSYTCMDGFSGCVTATCKSGGTWEYSGDCEIVCDDDDLQPPFKDGTLNSYDDEYVVGAVVTYTCPDGTSGCVTATCNDQRDWDYSGSCDPVCDPAQISAIGDADQVNIPLLDHYVINSVVEFECKDTFTGNPYLQCVEDGNGGATWEEKGKCDAGPHDCGPFDIPVAFAALQTNTDPCATQKGDELVFECLHSEATVTYTCTDEGWTTDDPPCPPPGCDAPEQTMDGQALVGEAERFGDIHTATYATCLGGTSLTRTCDVDDGEWSDGSPATCPNANCGPAAPVWEGLALAPLVTSVDGVTTATYPCCLGCDSSIYRKCDENTGTWTVEGQCPDDTTNLPCDISSLTHRPNDNQGYSYDGCCYYATEAGKNLDYPEGKQTNAVTYCDADGTAGAELAVPQTSGEAEFLYNILVNQNLADEIWVGYKFVGNQWVNILDGNPATIWYAPIDTTESDIVDGICLGLRDSDPASYFTTKCTKASHKHKAICKVGPT